MSLLTPNAMLRIKRSPASVTTEPASWAPPEFFWRPERAPALLQHREEVHTPPRQKNPGMDKLSQPHRAAGSSWGLV